MPVDGFPSPSEIAAYIKKHELEEVLSKCLNETIAAQAAEPLLEMARRLDEISEQREKRR